MRSFLFAILTALIVGQGQPNLINGRCHDGEEITCDLPAVEHVQNSRSQIDGRGLCVVSSIEMAARWQGLEEFRGFCNWAAHESGGAYPAKVVQQIKSYCARSKIAVPPYAQYEGRSPDAILDWCERTGRMACITYGTSPRYRGVISHMVCCVKNGGRWAVVLDNNFPGEQSYEWMSREELLRRISYPDGRAWVFAWLAPSPPPAPRND